MADRTQRQGRFQDIQKGADLYQGYRDVTKEDPYDKKFLNRQFKEYSVLKKGGLPGNLKQLRGMNDVELEALAAKAVIEDDNIKRRKLPVKLNKAKYNIKWAKKVMAKRAAGKTVRRQALRRTKAARAHILRVQRNRRINATPLYENLPKGY